MHKPGQFAAVRTEFRAIRKPLPQSFEQSGSDSEGSSELRRVRMVHAALTFPAAMLIALATLNFFKQPYNIAAMLVGCALLLLSIRTASSLNQAEAKEWRGHHARRENSAATVISSGILGDASGFWYRQYETAKKIMVALLFALLMCGLAVVARTMLHQVDDLNRILGWTCIAIGVAQMIVGAWTVFAMFMHRNAFLTDYQALFEDSSPDDAKDAYRGLIAAA